MLKILRFSVLASSVIMAAAWSLWSMSPFIGERPKPRLSAEAFRHHLDTRVPALLECFGVPSVSVATLVDGLPADTYAYGFADPAHGRSATPDTVYEVASISKSFTAWGVMRLVDAEKIVLDAPVERYIAPWPLPDSPFPRDEVTVRRLLNHTAGVNPGNLGVRSPDEPALDTRSVLRGEGEHPLVETAGPTRLEFAAGERFLYSNPGYTLLQLAIEQQTDRLFAEHMKHEVLRPLGMTYSSFDWDQEIRSRTAVPHLADGSPTPVTILQDQATGSLFSTAPDLAKFLSVGFAPADDAGLSPASLSALHAPDVALPPTDVQGLASDAVALGHYVEQLADGRAAIMNGGFAPGWTSQFYVIPSSGDGIVALTNSDRGRAVIAEIVADWAAWRGLSTLKMTRTYAQVGVAGPIAISVIGLIALAVALDTVTGLLQRQRRFGPVRPGQVVRAMALLVPALMLGALWFGFARMIVMFGFPWLAGPMSGVVVVLAIASAASAVLPKASQPPTGTPRGVTRCHVRTGDS